MGEVVPNFKNKSLQEFLLYLNEGIHPPDGAQFQLSKLAIEVKLIGKLSDIINTASVDVLRQSGFLKETIEAARNNFITESGALRKSMGEIRSSLEEFRESNEKSSKALTVATYVLAGVASIQAVIFALQWLK